MPQNGIVTAFQTSTIVICAMAGMLALVPFVQDARWNEHRDPLSDRNDLEFFTRATYYFSYVNCEEGGNDTRMTCPPGFTKLSKLRRAYKRDLTHPLRYNENFRKQLLSQKNEYLRLERRDMGGQFYPIVFTMIMVGLSSLHLLLCCIVNNFTYRHVLNIWFHWIGGTILLGSAGIYWRSSNSIHANEDQIAYRAQNQAMEFYNRLGGRYFPNNTLRGAHACSSYMSGRISGCAEMKNYVTFSGMCSNEVMKFVCLFPLGFACIMYYITCCVISCSSAQNVTRTRCPAQATLTSGTANADLDLPMVTCPPYSAIHASSSYLDPPPPYESLTHSRRMTMASP